MTDQELSPQDQAKRAVGRAAVARYVRPGMLLGLGTGTTMRWVVHAVAELVAEGADITAVPTSTRTRDLATELGIPLIGFDEYDQLDLVIDGADEVDPAGSMIKGGGAALLWERIVADSGRSFLCVADNSKLVETLGAFPLPIEVIPFGWEATARALRRFLIDHGYPADVPLVRRATSSGDPVITDSGNFLIDAHLSAIPDPFLLDRELNWIPGVVESGLFTGICDRVIFSDPAGQITVLDTSQTAPARPSTTVRGRRLAGLASAG